MWLIETTKDEADFYLSGVQNKKIFHLDPLTMVWDGNMRNAIQFSSEELANSFMKALEIEDAKVVPCQFVR